MYDKHRPSPSDSATVRVPPPLILLAALGVGLLMHWLGFELFFSTSNTLMWRLIGGVLFLLGLAINALAVLEFKRTHQNPSPRTPTPELVEKGPYRISRNPMYLGLGLFQIGLGLFLMNLWVSLLAFPAWIAVFYLAIIPEEDYLEQRFGDQYRQYRQTVRRWI